MTWLNELDKFRDRWIGILNYLGEYEYHEDIIHEAYLKLWSKYGEDGSEIILTNGQPNMGLMFTVLRNTFLIYKSGWNDMSQKKRIETIPLGEGFEVGMELDEEQKGYGLFLKRLDRELSTWTDFDRKVYRLYVGTYGTQNVEGHGLKRSIRKLSLESGISVSTIFQTMKRCKETIKENLSEDWQDYLNNDYEHIK